MIITRPAVAGQNQPSLPEQMGFVRASHLRKCSLQERRPGLIVLHAPVAGIIQPGMHILLARGWKTCHHTRIPIRTLIPIPMPTIPICQTIPLVRMPPIPLQDAVPAGTTYLHRQILAAAAIRTMHTRENPTAISHR